MAIQLTLTLDLATLPGCGWPFSSWPRHDAALGALRGRSRRAFLEGVRRGGRLASIDHPGVQQMTTGPVVGGSAFLSGGRGGSNGNQQFGGSPKNDTPTWRAWQRTMGKHERSERLVRWTRGG